MLVRPYAADGVRVTAGDPHENDLFLAFATDPEIIGRFLR